MTSENLSKSEKQYLDLFLEISNKLGFNCLLGGSIALKLQGIISRECLDLDIVIPREVDPNINGLMTNNNDKVSIYPPGQFDTVGTIGSRLTGQTGCVFCRDNIDDYKLISYGGYTLKVDRPEHILEAKEAYVKSSGLSKDKHERDIKKIKMKLYIDAI